jgi:hypothetical protein
VRDNTLPPDPCFCFSDSSCNIVSTYDLAATGNTKYPLILTNLITIPRVFPLNGDNGGRLVPLKEFCMEINRLTLVSRLESLQQVNGPSLHPHNRCQIRPTYRTCDWGVHLSDDFSTNYHWDQAAQLCVAAHLVITATYDQLSHEWQLWLTVHGTDKG